MLQMLFGYRHYAHRKCLTSFHWNLASGIEGILKGLFSLTNNLQASSTISIWLALCKHCWDIDMNLKLARNLCYRIRAVKAVESPELKHFVAGILQLCQAWSKQLNLWFLSCHSPNRMHLFPVDSDLLHHVCPHKVTILEAKHNHLDKEIKDITCITSSHFLRNEPCNAC